MKKVLLLLLFINTSLYAQIPIGQPADLPACDNGNDGVETFDLTTLESEILNGLNPSEYSVSFFNTLTGAQTDNEAIDFPMNYEGINQEMIYVRVQEIADPTNFEIATFELLVNAVPVFDIADAIICEGQMVVLDSGLQILPDLTFEWRYEDVVVPGATTSQLVATQAGTYKSLVTSVSTGCSYEDTAEVIVNLMPQAVIIGNPTIGPGEITEVTISGPPNGTVSYTLDLGNGVGSEIPVVLNSSGYAIITFPIFDAYATFCLHSVSSDTNPGCVNNTLNCFTIVVNSTDVINIPDTNFKAKLLSANASPFSIIAKNASGSPIVIDVNANGEIEESEALLVYWLSVRNSGIADLTGIEYFTNLKWLEVDFNPLTSLNTTGLTNLEHLASYNCSLTTANLSDSVNLKTLMINNNQLGTLNISSLVDLEHLVVGDNQLAALDVTGLSNLKGLYCPNNLLTELNVNSLVGLESLDCANNLLMNLSIDNLVNLTNLYFGNSGLNPVEVNAFVNLKSLFFYGGLQTTMDISNLVNLNLLGFSNTNLTGIDVSNNPYVGEFMVVESPNLTYLNIKDGTPDSYVSISNCPSLITICANEEDVEQIYSSIVAQGASNPNLSVTSYCTFTPGGNYNTIKGSIVYDFNNNGCEDDIAQSFIKLNINDGTEQGYSFADSTGNYTFHTQEGNFTITPQLENATLFTVAPVVTIVNFPEVDNSVSTNNFCITPNGVHPDVEIVIAPILPARPGFDAVYKIVYKNKGNQVLSGDLSFEFNDDVLDLISSVPLQDNTLSGFLGYAYANLMPFENREILITFNVNGPMENPAVNIDDILNFTASVVVPSDENPTDNTFAFSQVVVGSYDPNDKQCIEGDILAPNEIGGYLHYLIRFENTGTAPAENIVVKDVIDTTMFEVSSLRIMNSSHPVEAKVTGNVAEFIFKNINLETNGHGNILLKVKTNSTLNVGDVVKNKADIFFDYNFPIITNEATTLFQDLGIEEHNIDASISIYPNPTKDVVNIKADSGINSIRIYDVQGRLLMTRLSNQATENIDFSNYSTGIYYLSITTDKGNKTEKLIKE